jgi:hypothetical protein
VELIRRGLGLVAASVSPPTPSIPLFDSGIPDLAERVDEHLGGFGE